MGLVSLLFLAVVAVASLVALAYIQSTFAPSGRPLCSICRATQQCSAGMEGQCCCRVVDADGCYHGLGLCEPGLVCVPDGSTTGVCRADPTAAAQPGSCDANNYRACAAAAFGDCCCPRAEAAGACAPGFVCHHDEYRFIASTGVCVPPELGLPSPA